MGSFLDSVPVSAIIKIRDLMVTRQGSVPPRSGRRLVRRARLGQAGDGEGDRRQPHALPADHRRAAAAAAARGEDADGRTAFPIGSDEDIVPTNGGTHAIWAVMHALFEPGDEMIVPDPEWPPTMAIAMAAKATPVARADLREARLALGSRRARARHHAADARDLRELAEQPDRRRADAERPRADRRDRAPSASCGCISDEAYEDIIYKGEHVSIASLPGMYERTIPIYTFSKSYAMTGLRLGYFVMPRQGADATRHQGRRLHDEQRQLGRAVRRHRRARRLAGLSSRRFATSSRRGATCSTQGLPMRRRES